MKKQRKRVWILLFMALLITVLALAAMIPYIYQSQSILYKFGVDKTMLRLGKVAGLLAATLLLLQIISVSRLKIIDLIISRKKLLQFHQIAGITLVLLALLHPLLVFWPEDLSILAVKWQYWPEVLGALLLLFIWIIVATAKLRVFLKFSGLAWMRFHRAGVNLAAVAVVTHTITVSDTFEQTVPRTAIFCFAVFYGILWLRLRIVAYRLKLRARQKRA